MASRAGARIVNAEYVQFHPTALAVPGAEGFLISEAVRGEGGILLTPEGQPFMEKYAPEWKDLAPRDVVARAIHQEMTEHAYTYVLLDIASHMDARVRVRFPNIYDLSKAGIDITRERFPQPAAIISAAACKWTSGDGRTSKFVRWARSLARDCTANRLASTRCWRMV
jgi:L-aspartate oxidase